MSTPQEAKYQDALRKASTTIKTLMAENSALKSKEPVAVIGIGCRFPGGVTGPETFWQLLENEVDAVGEIPPDRWDVSAFYDENTDAAGAMYTRYGSFLENVYDFDAGFFGITPREAAAMDPQQRLLMEVSWETLENAGLSPAKLRGSRTGVFIGQSNYDYIQAHIHSGDVTLITPQAGSGVMFSTNAGRLSYFYDFQGPCLTLDTACSSSLVSVYLAMKSLQNREADFALAGGVNLLLSPDAYIALCKVQALSKDGRCRAFDNLAGGYGRGEGCGLLAIKRLSDAKRDGDRILAVLKGGAVNHDGKSNGLTAPNGTAQRKVLKQALADAGLEPQQVDYIEAHGTGTILGDPIEFNALQAVFGKERSSGSKLQIGSVKTNFGHTEASAGVAGLIKVILSLQKKQLPASLHCAQPNEHISWQDSSIEVVRSLSKWEQGSHARAAGVSSFGLSGTNAHLIVQEAPVEEPVEVSAGEPTGVRERSCHLIPISAASEDALRASAGVFAEYLQSQPDLAIADVGFSCAGRMHLRKRAAVLAQSTAELVEGLQSLRDGAKHKRCIAPPDSSQERTGKKGIVFLYSGQGAQFAGMARTLYETSPVFADAIRRCDEILRSINLPLVSEIIYGASADESEIHQTKNAQPALFAVEYALTELWKSWGITPAAVIGHSIGEYAAACACGFLSLEEGVRLAAFRGQAMQALPARGGMAVAFSGEEAVREVFRDGGFTLSIAAVNSPQCVTVSGDNEELDRLLIELKQRKIAAKRLNVYTAFHSPLMNGVEESFLPRLLNASFGKSYLPFYSTVTGKLAGDAELKQPDYWIKQILNPVLFYPALKTAVDDGYSLFLEVGPSNPLTALVQQCAFSPSVQPISSLQKDRDDWDALLFGAASLYVNGIDLDWNAYDAPYQRQRVDLPNYPFQRKRYWMELSPYRHRSGAPVCTEKQEVSTPVEETNTMKPVESQQQPNRNERQVVLDDLVGRLADIGGFDRKEVDPTARLMEIGLDSLMLFKMGQEIEQQYQIELKVSQFFQELSSLSDVADYIVKNGVVPHSNNGSAQPPHVESPSPAQPIAQGFAVPPQPAAFAVPPAQLSNDYLAFFQQQWLQMQQTVQQGNAMLFQLAQQQMAAMGGVAPGGMPAAPVNAPQPPAVAKPAQPKERTSPRTNFRGVNLAKTTILNEPQKKFIEEVVERHIRYAPGSKALTQKSRPALADWKHTLSFWGLLKEAKFPVVSARSAGSRFWDVDGNEYIDIAIGMGVHFFGHNPPFIVKALKNQIDEGMELGTQCDLTAEVAALVAELTGMERATFCNTGSEAVMFSLRLARAATKRDKIVLFKQSYHGIFDGVLAEGEEDRIEPVGLGTPQGMVSDVYVLEYGADASLEFIKNHQDELAAVLVETVQSRNPDLQPQRFLRRLRKLTEEGGVTLIFDEMITGFRVHPGGAQAWFGVQADIAAYGKIAGGGMPIGVIAGKAKYLDYIDGGVWDYGDHSGPTSEMIYYGGTFGRNPMTMAAAHAVLTHIKTNGPALQLETNKRTTRFCAALNHWFERERVPLRIKHFASQWRIVPLGSNDMLNPVELELLFLLLLQKGVYTWERRICFFSTEHSQADIDHVERSIREGVQEIRAAGFAFESPDDTPVTYATPSSVLRRLYALSQRPGGEMVYHLPQSFWVNGPLDIDRLEDCFAQVIQRHESLRMRFMMLDGELIQHVVNEPRFSVERYHAVEDEVDAVIRSFYRPFDLEQAPMLRVGVITISPQRHLLMADAHHIVVDGLSFNVIAQEFMELYNRRALQPVAFTYRECLRLQEAERTEAFLQEQETFWRQYLGDEIPVLSLPTDFARPAVREFKGNHIRSEIEPDVTVQLKTLGRQTGASLYMILLSVFNLFISRLSGQEEILVGAPVSGRTRRESQNAVGMFVNTIVLRNRVEGEKPFRELLASVKQSCAQAYDHQDYPFELLVEKFAQNQNPSRNPVFDVMLSYENGDARRFDLADLTLEKRDINLPTAMFDFSLDVVEEQNRLYLDFAYDAGLFRDETAQAWVRSFHALLQGILNDPDRPTGSLPMIPQDERERFTQWNQTDAAYPNTQTIVDLFEEQVAKTPQRTAIRFLDAAWTYDELNGRANAVARAILQKIEKPSGGRVAVLLEKSHDVVAVFLGILKAGCAYVPVDPDYPKERIAFLLQDSQCLVGISDNKTLNKLKPDNSLDWILLDEVKGSDKGNPNITVSPDSAAYCIYTSGSTGKPKGCLISHRNVVRLMKNDRLQFDFNENDIWAASHSFCFDFSVWEMYGALLYGGCVVVAAKEVVRDSHRFLEFVRQNGVTVLNQTPAAFYNLTEAERAQEARGLSHLRYVIFGGDRLDPAKLAGWTERYPLNDVALINMYGITETTVHVTFHRITDNDIRCCNRSPVGLPIPETRVFVCNAMMEKQPIGVVGEMYVGGSGVCLGYLNREELTKERFIPSPFHAGERLYKTGDLGRRLADGSLEYIGRNDAQVQVRGHRVEPGEVASSITRHPKVESAVVLAHERSGGIELAAYIVSRSPVQANELLEYLSEKLPAYMIPSRFVSLDALPLTSNGKVDAKALAAMQPDVMESGNEYAAPRNGVERAMAEVWQDVLKIERVGIHDNYFAIGGDSIQAIFVVNRLQKKNIAVTMSDLMKAQTIAALAPLARVDESKDVGTVTGAFAATPIQRWFFEQHKTQIHQFNHSVTLRSKTSVDTRALKEAVLALVNHHDAFRICVTQERELMIAPPIASVDVSVQDLCESYSDEQLNRIIEDEQAKFTLDQPPLLRVALIRLPDEEVVVLTAHHLAVDGVSWQIILDDFETAYNAALHQQEIALPQKRSTYIDWANTLARYAESDEPLSQLEYWQSVERESVSAIPRDYPAQAIVRADAESVDAALNADETQWLKQPLPGSNSIRTIDLLLAALANALFEWRAVGKTRIHLESHGRESLTDGPDLSRAVGWFTSLYPVVLEHPASGSIADSILSAQRVRSAVPQNGVGYGLLRYLTPSALVGECEWGADASLVLNYLGETATGEGGLFRLDASRSGARYGKQVEQPHALELECVIIDGCARFTLTYNHRQWKVESVQNLLAAFMKSLRVVLQFCRDDEQVKSLLLTQECSISKEDLSAVFNRIGITDEEVEAALPLAPLQEGILFHSLDANQTNAYFEQFTFRIRGRFDSNRFQQGWDALVQRHSILRTLFVHDRVDEPLQIVLKNRPVEFQRHDWRSLSGETQQNRLAEYQSQDRKRGFDLTRDPLMRFAIIQTADDVYEIVWSHHHIILDGWSMGILYREIAAIDAALQVGQSPALQPVKQYADYVRWYKNHNASASRAYWKSVLENYTEPAILEHQPNGGVAGYALEEAIFTLSREVGEKLKHFAHEQGATLNIVFQTAWAAVLAKYCRKTDVVFGAVVSGRQVAVDGIESIVGMTLNTVPVRTRIDDGVRLDELVRRQQAQYTDGVPHHALPLPEIFALTPLSNRLFEYVFVFENYPLAEALNNDGGAAGSGYRIEDVRGFEQMHFPLGLVIHPGDAIEVKFTFNRNLYSTEQVAVWMNAYRTMLERAVQEPSIPVHDIIASGLLSPEPETALPLPNQTALDCFEERCALQPDAVALEYSGECVTYKELDDRAERLAWVLKNEGVQKGDIVGLFVRNGVEHVAGIIAVMKLGGVFLPLDVGAPQKRFEGLLRKTAPKRILTSREHQPALEALLKQMPSGGTGSTVVLMDSGANGQVTERLSRPQMNGTDPAYIIFTSGSTGDPKSILCSHESFIHFLQWQRDEFGFDPSARASNLSPTTFDVSLREVFTPLISGGTVCVPPHDVKMDTAKLLDWLDRNRISVLHIVPSLFRLLLAEMEQQTNPAGSLKLVRRIFFAGEALLGKDIRRWNEHHPSQAEIVNLYGPSETTLAKFFYRVPAQQPVGDGVVPLGSPIAGAQAILLKGNVPAPAGTIGEICIAPPFDCLGYFGDEELTAQKFVPNPVELQSGRKMYRTGDLGRVNGQGIFEFIGRTDRQLKVNGVRVELAEIDQAVLACPGVDHAVVTPLKKEENQFSLVCYYTEKEPVTPQDLRSHLSAYLTAAMIPQYFVKLDSFPLNLNGKVDFKALPKPEAFLEDSHQYTAPESETERRLEELWKPLLGLSRVSVTAPFVELGGTSLMAMRLIARINKAFDSNVTIRDFFDNQTIRNIAGLVNGHSQDEDSEIPRAPKLERYPLSSAQRRLWILDQIQPGLPTYNIPYALKFKGNFKPDCATRAMETVVKRHEILRTSFITEDSTPYQVIHDTIDLQADVIDLSQSPDALSEVTRLLQEDAQEGFDLNQCPLFRLRFYKLDNETVILYFNVHHIIFDGWSVSNLVQEFLQSYKSLVDGKALKFDELPIQYKDYAYWEQQQIRSGGMDSLQTYWKNRFENTPAALNLPTDFPAPAVVSHHGDRVSFTMDAKRVEALRSLCGSRRVTFFMLLDAAVKTLLYRYTAQTDITIGTPIANRGFECLERQIGFYVNTLALRNQFDPNASFGEMLKQVSQTVSDAFDHQAYPFDRLVEETATDRDPSRTPVFEVMLILQNFAPTDISLNGMSVEDAGGLFKTNARFSLVFEFVEQSGGTLLCNLEYNTDLFTRERIERMANHVQELLGNIASNPDQPLCKLEYLTAAERDLICKQFNRDPQPVGEDQTVVSRFNEVVKNAGKQDAVVCDDRTLTYRQLDQRANALASELINKHGIQPGDRVAVALRRFELLPVAFLGVLKAGGVYIPIDPQYPNERIRYMLQDSNASCVLVNADAAIEWNASPVIEIESVPVKAKKVKSPALKSNDLAYMIYTSGSTGNPKGVLLEHGGGVNLARFHQADFGVSPDDRVLQFAPSSFDASVWEMLMALLNGATLVVATPDCIQDLHRFRDYLSTNKVTVATLPPSYAAQLKDDDVETLRLLVTAGEKARVEDLVRFGKHATCVNAYGPTETTVCATYHTVDINNRYESGVPIGKPILNSELFILDENRNLLPIGVPGEICIGGVGLARGYHQRDELTRGAFVPHPFRDGQRVYRTGDVGVWLPNGEVQYIGRFDHQVKIRGHRVECGEVEHVLSQHPAIEQAVVATHTNGGNTAELVGYYVSRQQPAPETLREFLENRLPVYMVPNRWVRLEQFPLNPSGKVDRKALPAPNGNGNAQSYAAPETDFQKTLAQIWRNVLQQEEVGIHDRFFELGGDSIKAILMMSRLREAGYHCELRDFFQSPTIAGMEKHVQSVKPVSEAEKELRGDLPLTPIQRWFFQQPSDILNHFNQSVILINNAGLQPDVVRQAITAVAENHDAFRIRYRRENGEWKQYYSEKSPVAFDVVDLTKNADPAKALSGHAGELQHGFDLHEGPLFKAIWFRMPNADRLLLLAHHAVVDGVSWRIILEDLSLAVRQVLDKKPVQLLRPSATYRQWSNYLQTLASGHAIQRAALYWQDVLKPANDLLMNSSPTQTTYGNLKHSTFALPLEWVQSFLTRAHTPYQTEADDLLLTALARALRQWKSKQKSLVLLERHGRDLSHDAPLIDRTVGWFTRFFPFRLELPLNDGYGYQIKTVKESLRAVPQNGFGYGLMRYLSAPDSRWNGDDLANPFISVNYLGHLDKAETSRFFGFDTETATGSPVAGSIQCPTPVGIEAVIMEEQFHCTVSYDTNLFTSAEIEPFSAALQQSLRDIVEHCVNQGSREITPSDVSRVKMDLEEFDALFEG